MASVVFLKGVNIGGHRSFSPSRLARKMATLGIINVGAAGTFAVRKPSIEPSCAGSSFAGYSNLFEILRTKQQGSSFQNGRIK